MLDEPYSNGLCPHWFPLLGRKGGNSGAVHWIWGSVIDPQRLKTGSKSDSSESGIDKGIELELNIVIKNQQTTAKFYVDELCLPDGEISQA